MLNPQPRERSNLTVNKIPNSQIVPEKMWLIVILQVGGSKHKNHHQIRGGRMFQPALPLSVVYPCEEHALLTRFAA